MANEQPHCFPFLQKELQLTVNLHWQFPYVSCTMAALFQAIDNIMQYPCLILFHTFSYCLTLLIPLYIILLEACFILFHFFASSCPISHTRTHAQTHTHRAAAPVQGGRYFARQTPVSRIAKWVNEFNEGMMKVTSWTSQNESVLRFWQHIAQKLHRCLWDCIAQTWQQHLGHSIFGSSKWGS